MLLCSVALVWISGLFMGIVFEKCKLPAIIGMILAGILIGPHMLGYLDDSLLSISADLRQVALVIILTRAGFSLRLEELKRVGRPAVLLCFVPACFEIAAVMFLGMAFFSLSWVEAALMGSVLAAVSPAVVVPRMIALMEKGYGKKHSVPQMLLAGASLDDIFVIVLFSSFLMMAQGGGLSYMSLLRIPLAIVLGALAGFVCAQCLLRVWERKESNVYYQVILLLSVSFLLLALQDAINETIGFSGLVAIMVMGMRISSNNPGIAKRLLAPYNGMWKAMEIVLFVLVGACVDVAYVMKAGMLAIVLIVLALGFRVLGVALCVSKTPLTQKERFFCMGAYLPKATVQASIGAIALEAGLPCGELVLTVAVLSILLSAPLGAIFIDKSASYFLRKEG